MRSLGYFASGTIAADGGGGNINRLLAVFEADLLSLTCSNGVPAWRVEQDRTTTGSYTYKMYSSAGDRALGPNGRGDTRIVFGMSGSSTGWAEQLYLDWDTGSSTGINNASNPARSIGSSDTSQIRYWHGWNEYESVFIVSGSTTWRVGAIGEVVRNQIPWYHRGRAFLTAASVSGSNIVLTVDRDLTTGNERLVSGGLIHIIDLLSGSGIAGIPPFGYNWDSGTIGSISTTSITINSLAQTHSAGAIIGFDPLPAMTSHPTSDAGSFYSNMRLNMAYAGLSSNTQTSRLGVNVPETSADPADYGQGIFQGFPLAMEGGTATGFRGEWSILTLWGLLAGSMTDGDCIVEMDGTRNYIFPSISPASTYIAGIRVRSGTV